MKIYYLTISFVWVFFFASYCNLQAQNPIIRNQFTADPSARVFNGKVYVYPSHDILAVEGKGRPDWFCMEDYHVFSSSDLTDWTDYGKIVSQNMVPWVDSTSYSMWAPDCIEKNNKYFFYFPANKNSTSPNGRKGFGIGVAIANKPEGPFIPQSEAISGLFGIDPNVFVDTNGQAYLYWAMGKIFVAKLKENMLELDSEPQEVKELPEKGLKEGPWVIERNGIYYMTYPHVENNIERLEYAMGNNPMGPFKFAGVIMDESPMNCWTNHQSLLEFNGQWYLFYHQNEYSPKFDKNRSICIDSLFFNQDGTIQKVVPSLRGVGISNALSPIQIDRYSQIGNKTKIDFLDSTNTFLGWKTILSAKGDWIKYNAVDFGNKKFKKVQVKALAKSGNKFQIRINNINGPLLAEVNMPNSNDWLTVDAKVSTYKKGIHNLFVVNEDDSQVEIDYISFK